MRQRIVTVLGVVVALLALYTLFAGSKPRGRSTSVDLRVASERVRAAVATEATGSTGVRGSAAEVPDSVPTEATEQSGKPAGGAPDRILPTQPESWGGDPFVRDWIMINELAELNLKAITLGGDKAYALINDQILEAGDQISGKRIVLIESDKVTLEQGGRTFVLLLGE